MIRRRDRLDDYVRRAAALTADQTAMLVDPVVKQDLFEEISRMETNDSPQRERQPIPGRLRIAAVATALAIVAIAAFLSIRLLGSSGQSPAVASSPTQSAAPSVSGDVFAGASAFSCVEEYGPQTVARRGFAFDGTITRVGERSSSGEVVDPYLSVVFTVTRWFRGGQGTQVAVAMLPPELIASVGNTPYKVGSRLLVSGEQRGSGTRPDELLAWACGFTRWYRPTDSAVWEAAFR